MFRSRTLARVVVIGAALLALTPSWSGETHGSADPILSSFLVAPSDAKVMDAVAEKFEVHHRTDQGFEVIVPADRANELRALVPDAVLLEEDIATYLNQLSRSAPEWLAAYRNFSQVETLLKEVADRHPDIAKLEVYGKSKEGRPLYALKLSDNVAIDEDEPEVMLTSATHGDELISVEVTLGLLEALVEGYSRDARLTKLVDEREIYIIPVVNPDGFTRKVRYANGVDPNREYPYPGKMDRNPNPCIKHLMAFFNAHRIKGSIDFHSHGRLVMYPWGYTKGAPAGEEGKRFREISRSMVEKNGYTAGSIAKLLYVAKGSSADYYHLTAKTLAFGIEIGTSNVPHPSQIDATVEEQLESTWRLLESL